MAHLLAGKNCYQFVERGITLEEHPPTKTKRPEVCMSASQIPYSASLNQVRQHIVHTLTKLTVDPHGAPFLDKYRGLREEWKGLQLQEFDLQDAKTESNARLEAQDDRLDQFTDKVDEASKDNERFRAMLFGSKTVSAFKRPIAGTQLKAMDTWPGTLSSPDAPAHLQLYAEEAGKLVKDADLFVTDKEECNRKLKEFYAIGAKKRFIEKLNLLRDETHRYFSQLVSEHPELKLGRRYPSSFFLQREGEAAIELDDEIAYLRAQIEESRDNIELMELRLKELLTKKEALEQEANEEKARQERIEALKQELALLQNKKR